MRIVALYTEKMKNAGIRVTQRRCCLYSVFLTDDANPNLQPMSDDSFVHAPKPLVDGRIAIGKHKHPRLRHAVQDHVEWRRFDLLEQCADVEASRIGETTEVCATLVIAWPVLMREIYYLIDALVPCVRE